MTQFPAAVISNVLVRAPNGHAAKGRLEAVIDTGAEVTILPAEIAFELRLMASSQRVRVWSYRKDEEPRLLNCYYVRLEIPSGPAILTQTIISPRKNILIGRAALMTMRLMIDWPAKRWSLHNASLPSL